MPNGVDEISKADARAETTDLPAERRGGRRETTVFVWSQSFGRCKRDWFIVQAVFGLVPELSAAARRPKSGITRN